MSYKLGKSIDPSLTDVSSGAIFNGDCTFQVDGGNVAGLPHI